jgi:hypothetical protein
MSKKNENVEEKPFKVKFTLSKIAVNSTKKDALVGSKSYQKFIKFLKNYANVHSINLVKFVKREHYSRKIKKN